MMCTYNKCRRLFQMGSVIHYCIICNKQFMPYRSFHEVCSDRCRLIKTERNNYGYTKKKDKTKKCPNCGTEFVTNNKKKVYCNTKCAVEYNATRRIKKETQTHVCEVCHSEFETTHHAKKYCSTECYKIAKRRRDNG